VTTAAVSTRSRHSRYVLTPWTAQDGPEMPSIDRAGGVYLYDSQGRRYLDLAAGLVAVNLGHSHPHVTGAIAEQALRLCYASPQFANDVRADIAERLSALSPWDEGGRSFFTTCGAQSNEDAVKMARTITGRHKILTAYRSFHGSSPGAGTLTGENRRWPNEPGIPGVVRFFAPYPYRSPFHTADPAVETQRALEHLETIVGYEDSARIAALIIEPVVGSNGAIVYPDGYLAGLREICTKHGIMLIFDEVMSGFGRTGEAFAAQRFGVTPDMIVLAKAITSAYVPLGAVLVRESFARYFDNAPLLCGHTYSGHPLAMAAARACLDVYEREGLFTRGRLLEGWLREGLERVANAAPVVGDVRGIGAFFAIELVRDRATREPFVAWQGRDPGPLPRLLAQLRDRGVYTFGRYNILLVTPPLTIERSELDEGLEALKETLQNLS
jgi:taurine---2-oxoglutarate transaminase